MDEQNQNQNQEPNQTPEIKTFTQDDVNRLIQERIDRERKKFADYDDLKSKLTNYEKEQEEKRQNELTEIQRVNEALQKAIEEKDELNKRVFTVQEQFNQERIRNAFIQKATAKNVAYIDAALKLADLSKVEINENGIVGLDEVVESLVSSNQFLLKQEPQQPREIGGQNNPPANKNNNKSNDQLLKEAAEKARLSGRAEDKIAYVQLKKELGF